MIVGRFEVPVDDRWHEVGHYDRVLAVNVDRPDVVEFWALVDDQDPRPAPNHTYRVFGTGQPIPLGPWGEGRTHWVGMGIWDGRPTESTGRLVWHLFESMP